ncbi:sensor histidine kinase [Lacrimispora sp. NSJ-141]|uniref:Sensor histidine kinase n=1 Tax=Lientehia hominis TaxID=2897778 RepID=A0AAP2RK36_9FIRM|nr:sensor histidine kinase [Lientehia hominis]MCD2493366.1 sensor histidine kinase [Lientehia hominis]
MKIQRKLILTYLGIAIIPMLISGTIMLGLLYHSLEQSTIRSMTNTLHYCTDKINEIFSGAEVLCDTIANNADIQKMLREHPAGGTPLFYRQRLTINNQLYSLRHVYEDTVSSVCLLLEDGRTFKGQEFNLYDIHYQDEGWYQEIRRENYSCVWYGLVPQSLMVHNLSGPYITMGYALINLRTGQSCGIILADIAENTIQDILQENLPEQACHIRLHKADGETVIEYLNTEGTDFFHPLSVSSPLENGWTLTLRCSVLSLMKNPLQIAVIVFLTVSFAITILAVFCSSRFSRSISRPLNQLLKIMDDVEHGNLEAQISIDTNLVEINQLLSSFNTMVEQVGQLFQKLEEEQTEIRKTQFAALQAQINPHFLYNTLDNIAWHIRSNDSQTALESLMAVSKLFRISLSKGHPYIRIQDELEHAKMYLELMSIRYEKQLFYEIRVDDPSLLEFYTPKLLLQPLIENSITHGISPRHPFRGSIQIHISFSGKDILLRVMDDGIGMDTCHLDAINQMLATNVLPETPAGQTGGFGIYNINHRLKSRYGDIYGLSIECTDHTTVSILIPRCNNKGECMPNDQTGCSGR